MKKEGSDERKHLPHEQKNAMMEIGDISKMFHDILRLKLEDAGISHGYRHVIFHLAHNDSLTQSELTKMAHLSAPSVSVTVEKMEREGLVEKRADELDGRQTRISLTDAGREADKRMVENLIATEKCALEGLDGQELETLKSLLIKMYDNLERERNRLKHGEKT
ncbi:MAG: winged helix-turn-helix transcriptional regulator [Clostridia bacterium]|nr:winged helix-turn-helix transcriptional regulator [Clostridia bacterium]